MIKNLRYAALAWAAVILVGCVSTTETTLEPATPPTLKWNAISCQQTDWYQIGRAQGENGKINTDIQQIAATCAEQGVQIDTNAYFQGLAESAQRYCTTLQGRTLGQQGAHYPSLCQPEIYSAFYYEWYKNLQQHCHAKSISATQEIPEACIAIKEELTK